MPSTRLSMVESPTDHVAHRFLPYPAQFRGDDVVTGASDGVPHFVSSG